jgi:hypothetical protein
MRSDTCLTEQQLRDFQVGNLADTSVDSVAQHLESCPRCEQLAQKLDGTTDPILNALRNTPPGPATEATKALSPRTPRLSRPPTKDGNGFSFLTPPVEAGEIGRLANYRVLKLLDKGGMGYVFLAEDLSLHRKVALKVMKPDLDDEGQYAERFLREARIMASIKHAHLVTIYQAGQEGQVVYLAMELLEGESLGARLDRDGACDPDDALRLATEISSGLAVVHRHGLVHRDLKPENIWLEGDEEHVKILDFGLARPIEDNTRLTQTGTIMGTPCFMSPEQARGERVDARSDLFSLGSVLYCVCTGKRPFDAPSTMAVLTALATETPKAVHVVNPAMPRGLSKVIKQLMAKNPAERPDSADAVVERLRAIEENPSGPTALARKVKPKAKATAGMSTKQWAAIGAAGVGLVIGIIVMIVVACMAGPRWGHGPAKVAGTPETGSLVGGGDQPAVEQGVVYLADLKPYREDNWHKQPPAPPFKGAPKPPPVDGVRIKGKLMPHAIFMHGSPPHAGPKESSITYKLGKKFSTFQTEVTLNDTFEDRSFTPIIFSIYGDGELLWRSKPVESQQDAQPVTVPVKNVELLKIEIACQSPEVRGAHAVWLDPRLK